VPATLPKIKPDTVAFVSAHHQHIGASLADLLKEHVTGRDGRPVKRNASGVDPVPPQEVHEAFGIRLDWAGLVYREHDHVLGGHEKVRCHRDRTRCFGASIPGDRNAPAKSLARRLRADENRAAGFP
jgi:hypothetical protein